jgi:hypothetical protein
MRFAAPPGIIISAPIRAFFAIGAARNAIGGAAMAGCANERVTNFNKHILSVLTFTRTIRMPSIAARLPLLHGMSKDKRKVKWLK